MVGVVQVMLGNKANTLVQLTGGSFDSAGAAAAGATCNYDVANDGNENGDIASTYTTIGSWLLLGATSDYEVRFTHTGGTLPTGTLNTWLALSSTQGVSLQAAIGNVETSNVTVEIRLASGGTVLASTAITLLAERF